MRKLLSGGIKVKLNRKIISAVSAAAVFVSMAIPAFAANSYTTSVTYDITSGKANFVTEGYADQNSEVTHIVYGKKDPQVIDSKTIYYVDQTTAAADGTFRFSYSVAADKAANTAVSVVGTDGANAIPASGDYSAIPGYKRVAVTNTTDKSVTFTQDNVKTIDKNGTGNIYVKAGADVTVKVDGAASFKYRIGSGADTTVESSAATVRFGSSDSSITISPNQSTADIDWSKWGTTDADAPAYNVVMTTDVKVPEKTAKTSDEADIPDELKSDWAGFSGMTIVYTGKVDAANIAAAKAAGKDVEYGIIYTAAHDDQADKTLVAGNNDPGSDSIYVLPALCSTENGEWSICILSDDINNLTSCSARTYVKIGDNYNYGSVVYDAQ